MREEERLTPAEREFENTLAGLQPAGASISRDQLMYRAGYAAGNRRGRLWQGTTALLTVGFAASLAMQTLLARNERSTYIAQTPTLPAHVVIPAYSPAQYERPDTPNEYSYIALRNDVLKYGLAALPQTSAESEEDAPLTIKSLLDESNNQMRRATSTNTLRIPGGRS